MCGRYTLTTPGGRALAERFVLADADALEPETLHRFNVCPTEPIAVAIAEGDERVARTMRWGLVPPWAQAVGKGFQPINARSETVATKAPFAELFARPERRCLVLADGWYEWLKAEKKGGARLPFRYTVDERRAVRVRGHLGPPADRRRPGPLRPDPHHGGQRGLPRRCTTGCPACSPGPTRRRRGWRGRAKG